MAFVLSSLEPAFISQIDFGLVKILQDVLALLFANI